MKNDIMNMIFWQFFFVKFLTPKNFISIEFIATAWLWNLARPLTNGCNQIIHNTSKKANDRKYCFAILEASYLGKICKQKNKICKQMKLNKN